MLKRTVSKMGAKEQRWSSRVDKAKERVAELERQQKEVLAKLQQARIALKNLVWEL